jgi:glycosyltransferase involved in cell wall biosynthesis
MLRTFLFLFCFITGIEASIPRNKTICLNMIVKDEAPVIRRCLDSVKPWIDYWIIVDTGSTDGTQEIIKEFMKDIPGELYERPWVNFGHNRDEALQLAENTCDYFMFVDADQELIHSIDSLNLDKDCYFCFVQNDGEFSKKILLANARCDWKWNGVLHEALSTTNGKTDETISGAYIYASYKDGHRAQDPQKHFKDIEILENAIKEDPNNGRYVLHLAQTYAACNELI